MSAHENYQASHEVELPSERSFGFVMTAAFTLFAALAWHKRGEPNFFLIAVALLFVSVTFVSPRTLRPLNIAWMKLGLFLGKIVTPIVLALIFFGVVTPVAVLMRLFGKDSLALRRPFGANSYWTLRSPPGPKGDSLRRQF